MNKVKGYETWVLFDEFQTFMDWPIAAQYFLKAWMEGRKYDLYQTGATQNVLAVLENAKRPAPWTTPASSPCTTWPTTTRGSSPSGFTCPSGRCATRSTRPRATASCRSWVGHAVQRLLAQGTETYKVFTSKPKETKGRAM